MTLSNSTHEAIRNEYQNLGGIESMFPEMISTIYNAFELDLNESDDPIEVMKQFFNDRYKGKKQAVKLADSIASLEKRNGTYYKKFNVVTKTYE